MSVANSPGTVPAWDIAGRLEAMAARSSQDPHHWQALLDAAVRVGDDDLALLAAQRLLELAPGEPGRQAVLADRLSEVGRVRDALGITRRLLERNPRHPTLPIMIAVHLSRMGRDEEALSSLRVALRRSPESALAWEMLANVRTFSPGDVEFAELERLTAKSPDRPEAAGFAYAFAKACDDIGDVERAYEWIERGSRRVLGGRTPRLDTLQAEVADVLRAFPPDRFGAARAPSRPERPILVLGCPRSGTTLVERILCSAPAAMSGGELKMLRLACLGFTPPSPERVDHFVSACGGEAAAWARVAETYVDRLLRRFGTADAVVDKGLVNYLYVGAVALALPEARIIHVERDPMDVAWSCLRRRFNEGLLWTYHPESIAAFMRGYADLMAHWNRVLPGRVLRISYERLLSDPEAETARLFAHAGLARPVDWREFHTRRGVVLTASQIQVRRPLNADGIGAWRRYGRVLSPLQDAMRRHGFAADLEP